MLAIPRAIPVRARSLALGLPLLLTGLLVLGAAPAHAEVTTIDTRDRAAVVAAYHDVYLPAVAVQAPVPPSSTRDRCEAGSTPAELQDATRDLVNYFRAMSGVRPVSFDAEFDVKAQQAALISYANGFLSHAPTSRSACWTAAGAEGAASSNLGLGYAGADVVRAYMDDAGASNIAAGHRWWLQRPSTRTMGNGTVGTANALWVNGDTVTTTAPRYTSWPAAGYLPAPLEPRGRWSFTAWDRDLSLSGAAVAVTGPGGTTLEVRQAPVDEHFGSLVFDLPALPAPTSAAADTYTVTVSGIVEGGRVLEPYRYQVLLFDPESDLPLEAVGSLEVSGPPWVGETLTGTPPQWSLRAATTSYQWFRGSDPIPGATAPDRVLEGADVGQQLTLVATGTVAGRDPVTVRSEPTAPVRVPAVVTVDPDSPDQGAVRLAVTVAAAGEPAVDGFLEVREDGAVVAEDVPVSGGHATWRRDDVSAGRHSYTVRYLGSERIAPRSAAAAVTVRGRAIPDVRATPTSSAVGALDLALAVSATDEPAPGGTVTLTEGTRTVAREVPVVAGRARWSARGLPSGRHTYTVHYSGTSRVEPGTATVTAVVRAKVAPVLVLRGSSPSSRRVAVAVTVTASGQSRLGGTVTVKEGTRTVKSGLAVTSGRASWTATGVAAGRHTYTVAYSGTTEILSGSARVTVTVKR